MPCCCPAMETAATSASPPASSAARMRARHHACGSTSVPWGCGARPCRTRAPEARSRISILQAWVDESTPATRVTVPPGLDELTSCTQTMLDEQLLQPYEREPSSPEVGVGVEVLERAGVAAQVTEGLPLALRRLVGRRRPRGGQRLGYLRIRPEGASALLEEEVVAHVGVRGVPDTVGGLGQTGLVVKVPRPVVGGAAAGPSVLQEVDEGERVLQVTVSEDEILVELDAPLPVEVDVEELPLLQGVCDRVREVQPRHL